ncbi:MAG: Fur family transcriptional regulator [Actinomycetota bacterium]
MATLVERLEASGLRLTAQRRAIAEALDGTDRHVTADDLLPQARARIPEIGRATVYKALAAFVETGEVGEFAVAGQPVRYDPNANVEHHHAVCGDCGSITDVDIGTDLTRLAPPGFAADSGALVLHGRCADCATETT